MKKFLALGLATLLCLGSLSPWSFASYDFTVAVFRPSDIPTGLVGYWKFNNDATDSSGSGYNLTANNTPTYTANGNYWKDAYTSNLVSASSQYYSVADQTPLDFAGTSYTWAFWIKPTTLVDGGIFNKQDWAPTNGYTLRTDNAGDLYFYQNNATALTTGSGTLAAGRRDHIAIVRDVTAGKVNFYKNGNLISSQSSSVTLTGNSNALEIGRYAGSSYQNGSIDDLACWSRALTPLEIKSLASGVDLSKYAFRPNNVSVQPTHWWKLNEVSGNRADSVSTNPLTATDTGTVAASDGYIEGTSAYFPASKLITVAASADHNFGTGDFTIRKRIKLYDLTTYNYIMGNRTGTGGFVLGLDQRAGAAGMKITSTDGTIIPDGLDNSEAWVAGVWYDLVWKRSGNTMYFYRDGVQRGAGTSCTGKSFGNSTVALQIGADGDTNYGLKFYSEDLAIWKGYALSDAEIKSLACALPIQRQGIVSYWKGSDLTDSVGTNTLTNNNSATFTAGKVGNAFTMVGASNQYLSITDAAQVGLDLTDIISILSWVKCTADGGTDGIRTIMSKVHGSGDGGYAFNITAGDVMNFWANDTNAVSAGLTSYAGVYMHAAVTFEPSSDIIVFYRDGRVLTTTTNAGTPTNTADPFRIGMRASGLNDPMNGQLDENVIAKRYFRPEEIKAVYLKGLNGKEALSSEISPVGPSKRRKKTNWFWFF